MNENVKMLNRLERWFQPHLWIAFGEVLFALALVHRPHAGVLFVIGNEHVSNLMAGMLLVCAFLAWWSGKADDFVVRTAAYMISLVPFFIYSGAVFYLFVIVRDLKGETVTLTTPLVYLGIIVLSALNYVLRAQLDFCKTHGADP
jgi:hypothetical protein